MSSRATSKFVKAALVAAACALVSSISQADSFDMNSVKVSPAGLDLNSNAGAQTMFKRLTVAAEQVCGGANAEFDALRTVVYRACYRETLSNAIRSLNAPMVTHAYVVQYPSQAAHYGITDGNYVAGR